MSKDANRIPTCFGKIAALGGSAQKIIRANEQTNLLALNATIEAATLTPI